MSIGSVSLRLAVWWRHLAAGVLCGSLTLLAGCGSRGGLLEPTRNHPPILRAQADTAGVQGDTLRLTAAATDLDGDPVSFGFAVVATLTEVQQGYRCQAGMDRATGVFWFVPSSADAPSRGFWFTATDGRGEEDSTSFLVRTP
jgi:predicted RecA/RadA family phage recombinase